MTANLRISLFEYMADTRPGEELCGGINGYGTTTNDLVSVAQLFQIFERGAKTTGLCVMSFLLLLPALLAYLERRSLLTKCSQLGRM